MAKTRTTKSKVTAKVTESKERFPVTDEHEAPQEKTRAELDAEKTVKAEKMILDARQQLVDAMLLMQQRQHNAGTKYSSIQKAIKTLQVFLDA